MPESYQFRSSYRGPRAVDAVTVKTELDRLAATDELQASRVLADAEPEEALLHPEFLWEESEAAHKYRLIQARALIRAVVVIPERVEGEKSEGRTIIPESRYVHVPESSNQGEGRYMRLDEVMDDASAYERALTEAQKDLDSAERRFGELRRLAEKAGGKVEALAIAVQAFGTIREALALLR